MGASAGGARGGYQRRNSRRRSSGGAISEINVTPLVDVMLVLLIVFMVAAPLMTVGVPIELPKTEASQMDSSTEPITISVQEDGKVFLMETEIELETLAPKLIAIAKNGYEGAALRARRYVCLIWQSDGSDGPAQRCGLSQDRARDRRTPDIKPLAAETQN
jgi:biopolymer transport protein ExbD